MVRIDCLLFGYRKIRIDPEKLSTATALLLRLGIPSRFNPDGTITVRERDFAKIYRIFSGRFEFSFSETLGIYGRIKSVKHKKAVLCALVVSLFMSAFLSALVWDVRIEGNENIPSAKIVKELSECGFEIGDLWFLVDRSKVETIFLLKNDEISWINVNRRGSVAYVKIIEKKDEGDDAPMPSVEYSNIVASADCVIEEITVASGIALVKPGDTVKKGDLLISGVLPTELGGGFCCAKGDVIGRVSDKVSVNIQREFQMKQEKSNKLYSLGLNLFNFSINIFKLYGNLTEGCDIIEVKKSLSLSEKSKLPFSLTVNYLPTYETTPSQYTDEQLVAVASSRLNSLMAARLALCDLVRMRTYGEFTESGYEMSCDMVFLTEVGETMAFDVN